MDEVGNLHLPSDLGLLALLLELGIDSERLLTDNLGLQTCEPPNQQMRPRRRQSEAKQLWSTSYTAIVSPYVTITHRDTDPQRTWRMLYSSSHPFRSLVSLETTHLLNRKLLICLDLDLPGLLPGLLGDERYLSGVSSFSAVTAPIRTPSRTILFISV